MLVRLLCVFLFFSPYLQKMAGDSDVSKARQRERSKMIHDILPGLIEKVDWNNAVATQYANEVSNFEAWDFLGTHLSLCVYDINLKPYP